MLDAYERVLYICFTLNYDLTRENDILFIQMSPNYYNFFLLFTTRHVMLIFSISESTAARITLLRAL